jgi:hypothetical protein
MLFLFGMLEYSLVMRDSAGVSAAVRVGARVAASGAGAGDGICPNPLPDPSYTCAPARYSPALVTSAINAMQQAGTGLAPDQVNYVLIYRANPSGWPGTATNASSAVAQCVGAGSNCVKFTYNKSADKYQYSSGSWDSSTINACINSAIGQSVGVYLNASRPFMYRLLGTATTMDDNAVMKFEPLPIQSCNGTGSASSGGHA